MKTATSLSKKIWAVTKVDGTILEQNDYYPFGLRTTRGENYSTLSQSLAAITQSANNTAADASAPEYLYNGKEKQEFIKNTSAVINAGGSAGYTSNYLDYGARFYNPTTLRWNTQDPLAEKYYKYSPYNYCVNNPISLVDNLGAFVGDYYTINGKWLGSDGKQDNLVYVASGVSVNANGEKVYTDSRLVSDNHKTFQKASAVVKNESSGSSAKEGLWIAHTANNAQKDRDINYKGNSDFFEQILDPKYANGAKDVKPLDDNNTDASQFARAAVLDVMLGGKDPTGGAVLWDGTDFLAKGSDHQKFKEYNSITISENLYSSYLENTLGKYTTGTCRFGGVKYNLPSETFSNKNNWNKDTFSVSGNSNSRFNIQATGVQGLTIFWKKTK